MLGIPVATGTKTGTRFCRATQFLLSFKENRHRLALAISQQNKLVSSQQNKRVEPRHDYWFFGYIHPYPDGNGRMARFLMNVLLASGGLSLDGALR